MSHMICVHFFDTKPSLKVSVYVTTTLRINADTYIGYAIIGSIDKIESI